MDVQDQFTAEEWIRIRTAPLTVMFAAIQVDGGGPIAYLSAITAFAKTIQKIQKTYPYNPLLSQLNNYAAKADHKSVPNTVRNPTWDNNDPGVSLKDISEIAALVRTKLSRDDGEIFARFLYDVGEAAASAAGPGWFGSGPKVSMTEESWLIELRQALDL